MKENSYKPQMPDMMEAIFDAAYLLFDLVAAILFFTFSKGNVLFILYGILTLTLCGGDAFHLVPRIIRAVHGRNRWEDKETAGNWIAGIVYHNDSILYYVDVYLEINIPRIKNASHHWNYHMDIGNRQNCDMHISTE